MRPLVQKCAKRNQSVMVLGSSSGPGTRPATRKLCLQVKLVPWHVTSWGEFLIHDLMKMCRSPSCYRFSRPVTCLCLPAPICYLPLYLSSGYAVLKKVKDSRCGTPLLLNQLPHQCIILGNLTSLPTQSFSLPTALTPSPPPTPFFPLFFISFLYPCSPVRLSGSPITAAVGSWLKLLPQAVSMHARSCAAD